MNGNSEKADVVCAWAGGRRTGHPLVRSVRRTSQMSHHDDLVSRIRALHGEGQRAPAIARTLAAEGWRSAHGKHYRESNIRNLMGRLGLFPVRLARPSTLVEREAGEYTPCEIAARLDLPEITVYTWIYKERLKGRRVEVADRSLWLVRLDDAERLLSQRGPGGRLPPKPPH